MNNGYSIDLRERVVGYIEQGGSKTEAVKLFKVSRKTIYNWLSRKAKTGNLAPNKLKKYKVRKLDDTKVLEQVEARPDATLAEMGEVFKVSQSGMWYALKRLV
jgi:putative transposase